MKSRIIWFLFFYIILTVFICYNLIYLGVIWSNRDLLNLYNHGFTVSGAETNLFNYSNAFAVYGLPTLGTLIALFGLVAAILSQSFILKSSTPKSKLVALSTSFIAVIIGFYLSFIGQLFYNEWNDTTITITPTGGSAVTADTFYHYWISLSNIWIAFGVFFLLFIIAIIVIIKLYYLNIQWLKYDKKENAEDLNLEITAPFPSNVEFDPNETQTITLTLDTDKMTPWKSVKKKDKIKKKKTSKKK